MILHCPLQICRETIEVRDGFLSHLLARLGTFDSKWPAVLHQVLVIMLVGVQRSTCVVRYASQSRVSTLWRDYFCQCG
jgi:hypothetical protein